MHNIGTGGGRTLVAIVYHSAYGHARRQAEAVRSGVPECRWRGGAAGACRETRTQSWDHLLGADALIFGTPTYMGAASAAFKSFQEATSSAVMSKGYRWEGQARGRLHQFGRPRR